MRWRLKIKNWSKFQHFKDRRPPWIKLHREMLDQRDIMMISACSFRLLSCLWLLASEDEKMEGNLPSIEDISFRIRMPEKEITKLLQELAPWVELSDIKAISERYQVGLPETETETEAYKPEKEVKKILFDYSNDFQTFWSAYPEKSGKGDAWKSWQKVKPPLESVLSALSWQVNSKKWTEGFIPNPATYLNQRRWEDEPTQAGITASKGAMGAMARAAALRKEQEQGVTLYD